MKSSKQELSQRWSKAKWELFSDSPFGILDNGLKDFRSVCTTTPMGQLNRKFVNKGFERLDLAGANLTSTIFDQCIFNACCFDSAVFREASFHACNFTGCSFTRSDFRASYFGLKKCIFDGCTFDKLKTSHASFDHIVFRNCILDGKDWSRIVFHAVGFWNCSLVGLFDDCIFSAGYYFQSDMDKAIKPLETGMHQVDLTAADFKLCGLRCEWEVEDVKLPPDGKFAFSQARRIRSLLGQGNLPSDELKLLSDFDEVFVVDKPDDHPILVSRRDLYDLGPAAAADFVYDLICRPN
jgi:uncharacterized protein YjbI with pentapeptide repeats